MKLYSPFVVILAALITAGCSTVSAPYGGPPDSSDPWELIYHARQWLELGRPRGALPSLQKALQEVEKLDHQSADYAHTRAAVHNEIGRSYEMASELGRAEEQFLKAAEFAARVPERRPLHFDISYNLSTVYERQSQPEKSCIQLRRTVRVAADILANPAEPPNGYGDNGGRFIGEVAMPRIRGRAARLNCDIDLGEQSGIYTDKGRNVVGLQPDDSLKHNRCARRITE